MKEAPKIKVQTTKMTQDQLNKLRAEAIKKARLEKRKRLMLFGIGLIVLTTLVLVLVLLGD